jgi:hypothetical protein
VEEKLTTGLCEREIAKVIKQDEIKTAEIVCNAPLFASACLALNPVDQINNVDEAAPETIADRGVTGLNGAAKANRTGGLRCTSRIQNLIAVTRFQISREILVRASYSYLR